jgi:Spy/CpxP family protein refolding chaperone
MKKVVVIALVMAVVLCASAVLAQSQDAQRRSSGTTRNMFGASCPATALNPPPAMLLDRADSLNLPAETKDKLKAVLTKGSETLQPLRQKATEATRLVREATLADDFSEAKVKELAAAAEKAEQAVIDAEIGVWKDIRGVLSADQVKALREFMTGGMGMGIRRQDGPGAPGAGGPGPSTPPPAP